MKTSQITLLLFAGLLTLATRSGISQGTFIYDQQSSDESSPGEFAVNIQSSQPVGQSFTPTFSTVGFVRLRLSDPVLNGVGATVSIQLKSNSPSGPVLASSEPVFIPDGFGVGFPGYTNFFFSVPAIVTPEVTYFFQPVIESGNSVSLGGHNAFGYSRGNAFILGVSQQFNDFWFREGIYVPEPATSSLLAFGAIAILLLRGGGGQSRRTRQ